MGQPHENIGPGPMPQPLVPYNKYLVPKPITSTTYAYQEYKETTYAPPPTLGGLPEYTSRKYEAPVKPEIPYREYEKPYEKPEQPYQHYFPKYTTTYYYPEYTTEYSKPEYSPSEEYSKSEYSPPATEYSPPAEEYSSPASEYSPPAEEYSPPAVLQLKSTVLQLQSTAHPRRRRSTNLRRRRSTNLRRRRNTGDDDDHCHIRVGRGPEACHSA